MKFLAHHVSTVLLIAIAIAMIAMSTGDAEYRPRYERGSQYADVPVRSFSVAVDADCEERHCPITVWQKGARKTVLTFEGECSERNALEAHFGVDTNNDGRLDDGDETWLVVGWDNTEREECKPGRKELSIVIETDDDGNMLTLSTDGSPLARLSESTKFNRESNIVRLCSHGKPDSRGNIKIELFEEKKEQEAANDYGRHL